MTKHRLWHPDLPLDGLVMTPTGSSVLLAAMLGLGYGR